MSKQVNGSTQFYMYSIRFPRPLWDRLQAYLQKENKRIGRTQITAEVLRQVFETGLSKLEKQ